MVLDKKVFENAGLSYEIWDFCFGKEIAKTIMSNKFYLQSYNNNWEITLCQEYAVFNALINREILLQSYSNKEEAENIYLQLVLSSSN
jgi:hypothetical protein